MKKLLLFLAVLLLLPVRCSTDLAGVPNSAQKAVSSVIPTHDQIQGSWYLCRQEEMWMVNGEADYHSRDYTLNSAEVLYIVGSEQIGIYGQKDLCSEENDGEKVFYLLMGSEIYVRPVHKACCWTFRGNVSLQENRLVITKEWDDGYEIDFFKRF